MEEVRGQLEIMLAAVEESAQGLFGAVMVEGGRTIWLRGRHALERLADGTTSGWRWMTDADVTAVFEVGAIDGSAMNRQLIRILR